MKAFIMERDEGVIGEGIEFSGGQVAVRNTTGTVLLCDNIDIAVTLHGGGDGKTNFTFTEELRT